MRNQQFNWRQLVFTAVCVFAWGMMTMPSVFAQTMWEFRAPMPTPRAGAAITVLNGQIYVIGGEDENGDPLSTVEVYDPETNTWATAIDSQHARKYAAAITHQGVIFLMGGHSTAQPIRAVEVFVPDENTDAFDCEDEDDDDDAQKRGRDTTCWLTIDALEKTREGLTTVKLGETIYALGGADDDGDLLKTVEYFDENNREWRITDSWELKPTRFNFATVAVNDSAYSIGGISTFGPLSLVERYHTSTGQESKTPMPAARGGIGAAAVDNYIYVAGGREVNNQLTSSVDVFDVVNNSWQEAPVLFTPREHAAVVAVGAKIFVIGGKGENGNVLNSVEMLNLEQIPVMPSLVSPVNGAVGQALDLTLNWSTDAGSTYELQVAEDAGFSSLFSDTSGLTAGSYNVMGMSANTTYFWRVRALNIAGVSNWSPVYSFSTAGSLPAIPVPVEPTDGALDVGQSVTFTWNVEPDVTSRLQILTDETASAVVFDQAGIEGGVYEFVGLEASTVYYWRVRAINSTGASDWSETYQFTTVNNVANEDIAVPEALELNENFPNPFFDQTTIVFKVNGSDSPVHLAVYDLLGRPVTLLVDKVMPGGQYQVAWNGTTDAGIQVQSGLYIYELRQGEQRITRKMMIVR